jgi:hypothetical protein
MTEQSNCSITTTREQATTSVVDALTTHDEVRLQEDGLTLFDFVDPDAMDQLFAHESASAVSVQFTIQDTIVTVYESDGQIETRVSVR